MYFEPQLINPPTWSIDIDIKKDNIFLKSFEQFGGLGLFSLATCSKLLNNRLCQLSSISFFFERVNKGELNMVNIKY